MKFIDKLLGKKPEPPKMPVFAEGGDRSKSNFGKPDFGESLPKIEEGFKEAHQPPIKQHGNLINNKKRTLSGPKNS